MRQMTYMRADRQNEPPRSERDWVHTLTTPQRAATPPERAVQPATTGPDASKPAPPTRSRGGGFAAVAGMDTLKQKVTSDFINPLRHEKCARAFGLKPPALLFYGPAGCGKTFFAERMADELGIHFMHIAPHDIASIYVHGSQERIGRLFSYAQQHAPTLLFLDEFDAMVPERTSDDRSHQNGEVNEFLCKLNNAADRGIYIVAATNHPDRIDRAVLRAGRIDECIYVGMPDPAARESLFRLELSKLPVDDSLDFPRLAQLTQGYNCSDISYMANAAARKMFNASINERTDADSEPSIKPITQELLEEIIRHKTPSVSPKDLKEFARMRQELSRTPSDPVHHIGFDAP